MEDLEKKKPSEFMTIREAARRGPLSEFTLRRMAAKNELPGYRTGKRFNVNYTRLLENIEAMKGDSL